jgi:hypothetical protein
MPSFSVSRVFNRIALPLSAARSSVMVAQSLQLLGAGDTTLGRMQAETPGTRAKHLASVPPPCVPFKHASHASLAAWIADFHVDK